MALLNCGHTSFNIAAKVTLIKYWLPELPMSICAIQVLLLVCIALEPKHPCLAANLRIGIYNGEMVFNRLLGNGWSDLAVFSANPHEISIPIKMLKKSAL